MPCSGGTKRIPMSPQTQGSCVPGGAQLHTRVCTQGVLPLGWPRCHGRMLGGFGELGSGISCPGPPVPVGSPHFWPWSWGSAGGDPRVAVGDVGPCPRSAAQTGAVPTGTPQPAGVLSLAGTSREGRGKSERGSAPGLHQQTPPGAPQSPADPFPWAHAAPGACPCPCPWALHSLWRTR